VKLLLVGAGHAHLEVLRRFHRHPLPGVELEVVSLGPLHHYSGMVPGYLQGTYREEEIAVQVPDLVARARGSFVAGRAVGVSPEERQVRVETAAGERLLAYDLVSFAVGSNTAGVEDPDVAGEAQRIKPLARVRDLRQRLLALAEDGEGEVPLAVVGGGAAGVEVALAAAAVLGRRARITLLDSGDEILAGYRERFRRRARSILAARGLAVRIGQRVAAVNAEEILTADGGRVPSRLTVWLTGAVAWPLFRSSGLPLDERGFLLLDDALRSLADPRIYAVREGPVLWQSLQAAIAGSEPPRYMPQQGFLSILNTADGRALLDYKGIVSHSRWAWRLKDAIDRRFLARYQMPVC